MSKQIFGAQVLNPSFIFDNVWQLGNFLPYLQNVVKYTPLGSGPQAGSEGTERRGVAPGHVFLLLLGSNSHMWKWVDTHPQFCLSPPWSSTIPSRYYTLWWSEWLLQALTIKYLVPSWVTRKYDLGGSVSLGMSFKDSKAHTIPRVSSLCLMLDQNISSQLLLQCHAWLYATVLPTMVVIWNCELQSTLLQVTSVSVSSHRKVTKTKGIKN